MPWLNPVASGPNALGDLSSQYWNVAQSNLRTQEGDIARVNAAQQNWNRWQANVADLTNQQEAEQYRRDQNARGEQRHQFEWNTGRADRAAELTADNALRREHFGQRSAESDQKNFATLQSQILGGQVRDLDEAWAYIPKTPDNVIRVNKLLDKFKTELTQKTLEAYDTETVKVQADQLAGIIKAKGAAVTGKDKEAAMWLDPQTLAMIPRKVGSVIPGAAWDYKNKTWTLNPENTFQPAIGDLRRMEGSAPGWIAPPGTATATPSASNDLVSVFNPAGQPVKIRRSQLTDAIAKGYRLR